MPEILFVFGLARDAHKGLILQILKYLENQGLSICGLQTESPFVLHAYFNFAI